MKLALGFLALVLVLAITTKAFEFTEKSEYTGMIFTKINRARVSYDSFTLLYHIDISEYLKMTDMVGKCINELERMCNHLSESNCMLIISKLRDHLKHMSDDELGINAYRISLRKKRGLINLGGKILHYLFGVIDEDTALEYRNEIEKVKNATEREHKVQTGQLLIFRESLLVNNQTYAEIKRLVNETLIQIHELSQFTTSVSRTLQIDERLLELSAVSQLMISEHERFSKQILDQLENTLSGKMSQLIPLPVLKADIAKISKFLHENQMLPIDPEYEDVLHLFRFTTIRAALIDTTLLIELTLPIVERARYTLYQTFPVPFKCNEETFITTPKSRLFILSDNMKEYIPIEREEYTHAVSNRHKELIFSPVQHAHYADDDSCEMNMLLNPTKTGIQKACDTHIIPRSNYFIAIEPNALYYVFVDDMVKINEQCRNKARTTHFIKSNGYIKLDMNCDINTDKISIRPHLNIRLDSHSIIELAEWSQNLTIKTLNEMVGDNLLPEELKDVGTNQLIQDHETQYGKLIEETEQLIRDRTYIGKFEDAHTNDVITGAIATSISLILSFIVIFIVVRVLLVKFFRIETWKRLAARLQPNVDQVPPIFIHREEIQETGEEES